MFAKELTGETIDMTDEDYERWSVDIIFRILPKAVIVSAVTGLAVVQFSGSYGKAIGIGLIALFMSLFRTWQRFLEPICAITFLVTVADVPIFNVGAAFWGLVFGFVVSWLLEREDFHAAQP